jgi:hypothetical protein
VGVPEASSDARSNPPAAARLLHRAGDGCQSEEDELDDELDEEDELLDEPDEVDAPAAAGLPEDVDDEESDDEESDDPEDEPEVAGVEDELARLSVR